MDGKTINNPAGKNGHNNGVRKSLIYFASYQTYLNLGPPDEILSRALLEYARQDRSAAEKLAYLARDHNYHIG